MKDNASKVWNVEEYLNIKEQQKQKIRTLILDIIDDIKKEDISKINKILNRSILKGFINEQLDVPLLEIENNKNYDAYFNLLDCLAKSETISFFKNGIYDTLKKLKDESENALRYNKNNRLAKKIILLYNTVDTIYNEETDTCTDSIEETDSKYVKTMKQYKLRLIQIRVGNHYYASHYHKQMPAKQFKDCQMKFLLWKTHCLLQIILLYFCVLMKNI